MERGKIGKLSHIDSRGEASMVDVSRKPPLLREAIAEGEIKVAEAALRLIEQHDIAKGNVLAVARIAAIQAAKRTAELIPLCHPLPLSHCEVEFFIQRTKKRIQIRALARTVAGTGVEMEALTAVAVAGLTIYDMCKAVDKRMRVGAIHLVSKTKTPLA